MKLYCVWLSTLILISMPMFSQAKSYELMSYNVENLFDAKHDIVNGKEKEDYAYLPKDSLEKKNGCKSVSKNRKKECLETNWTDAKVEMKLEQIQTALESEKTSKPNFIALIEVENRSVVERLAKKMGYTSVEITESPDERGVDVALLFNESSDIKKVSVTEHVVEVARPTRNILEVEFIIEGKYPLTIFVNHWPSLSNPDSWRVKAAETLLKRTKDILSSKPTMSFLAVGDFNTIPENNPHPFTSALLKDGIYFDAFDTFMADASISKALKDQLPAGSYFYPKEKKWNMLDHIFFSSGLSDKKELEVELASFRIHMPKSVLREWKIGKHDDPKTFVPFMVPKSFNHEKDTKEEMGFSDHLPLIIKLSTPDEKVILKNSSDKKFKTSSAKSKKK